MNFAEFIQDQQKTPYIVCPSHRVRPEEAYDLYRTGRRAGQVARIIGMGHNDTTDLIIEGQQIRHAKEMKRAIQVARLSVLARPQARVM